MRSSPQVLLLLLVLVHASTEYYSLYRRLDLESELLDFKVLLDRFQVNVHDILVHADCGIWGHNNMLVVVLVLLPRGFFMVMVSVLRIRTSWWNPCAVEY